MAIIGPGLFAPEMLWLGVKLRDSSLRLGMTLLSQVLSLPLERYDWVEVLRILHLRFRMTFSHFSKDVYTRATVSRQMG